MLFRASNQGQYSTGSTERYRSGCEVREVRDELMKKAQLSDYSHGLYVYVEVIKKGETEGIFLEEEDAIYWKLDDVSKLGEFWRAWPGKELISLPIEISSLLDPPRHRR